MTGYGASSAEREWGTITLELSSVNHRYQEISVRTPRELSSLEPWFHQKARGMFRRGKVQVRAEITWASSSLAVAINKEVLSDYYKEISVIRDSLGADRDISLDALVNLPGVMDLPGRAALGREDETLALLSELMERAAENWNAMRREEGEHLREAIAGHLADLERAMSGIARLWPQAKDAAFEAVTARIGRALDALDVPHDEARFAQEIIFMADKWDISEELARMDSHIAKFREIGGGPEPEGRKLDFLLQEMNREANTINSKISNSEIRWLAVDAKAAIERVREQAQNLE
jgi:uncharacterized protein (TIGR00255 family)